MLEKPRIEHPMAVTSQLSFFKRHYRLSMIIIMLTAVALRVYRLSYQSLRGDEGVVGKQLPHRARHRLFARHRKIYRGNHGADGREGRRVLAQGRRLRGSG